MPHAIDEPAKGTPPWREYHALGKRGWTTPFRFIDWVCANIAWNMGRWSLLKVLAYAETFSVLVALIFWIAESGQRTQQRHYQAWQVINTAQGKGGSGGRIDALEQLNDDHVSLTGVDVAGAFLQNVHLDAAELRRANFRDADLRSAHFRAAEMQDATMISANLRNADLHDANLNGTDLTDADLTDASLQRANLVGVTLDKADLHNADVSGIQGWTAIASMRQANIHGIKNAPNGFVDWAMQHGAANAQ